MEKIKQVTEEMKPQKKWFKEAEQIKTPEKLAKFANKLLNETQHDYGTVCHAIAAIALAGAWLGSHIQGITGFQAGFVMWDFIMQWNYKYNKCGLRIVDYDDMLYPQYEHKFDKTITKEKFNVLRKQAQTFLKEQSSAHPSVIAHWRSIAEGNIPFGYTIKSDD